MPRFFFDIHDGETFTPDHQGLDLDGLEAAKDEAKKTLPEIVKDEMPDGDRRDFTVNVKDTAGQIVWRVTLSLVVESPSRLNRERIAAGHEFDGPARQIGASRPGRNAIAPGGRDRAGALRLPNS